MSRNIDKPCVCLIPITMKIFWELYPDLENRTTYALDIVRSKLQERFELVTFELVGCQEEAEAMTQTLRDIHADLVLIWESGYVASGIPGTIVKALAGIPTALFITQRDKEIPEDMDYARYMESTAITSAMELGGALKRMGMDYHSIIGHMEDDGIYIKVERLARAAMVLARLKNMALGIIGYPYPGMLDISVDDASVSALGITTKHITLREVSDSLEAVTNEEILSFMDEVRAECDCSRIKPDDFKKTVRLYRTLEGIVKKYELDALCVHDYDCLSVETETVSDFALSYLENRYGLATSVEGDIPNCISAFIAQMFSGKSPMFVDWTMVDEKYNAIFLQHNGKADPAIVDNPVLSPSAEPFGGVVGEGVVFEASGKAGDVTLVSMIYRTDGWHIFAAEGEALSREARPCRLNQMTVRVNQPVIEFMEKACELGLGHHLNAAYGHFAAEVELFARLAGIKFHTV